MIVPIVALALLAGMHALTVLEVRRLRRERAAERRDRALEQQRTIEAIKTALTELDSDPEYWHNEREMTGVVMMQPTDQSGGWQFDTTMLIRKHRHKPGDL